MANVAPAIRILPMSKKEEEFKGRSAKEVQSNFFLRVLPLKGGRYDYRASGLVAKPGTIVLFQYDNQIIASAVLNARERFEQPDKDGFHGALEFDIDSIRVFKPVDSDLMREVWPEEFVAFRNRKSKLNAEAYPEFERRLTGIEFAAPQAPQACDLSDPPAARVKTTVMRIVRDSQKSRHVKFLHKYKCQLLTCEYTIDLADGSRYAEAHHVKPLGKEHNGPDNLDNIVCLCPNHHAACDHGAIQLVASELRQVAGHVVRQEFIDYHNEEIYPGRRA